MMHKYVSRIFNGVGISVLCSAVALQFFVFLGIYNEGYIRIMEPNNIILNVELILSIFALFYMVVVIKNTLIKQAITKK